MQNAQQSRSLTRPPAPLDVGVEQLAKWSPQGGGKYEPLSEGQHVLRFVDVVDCGEQEFQGKVTHRIAFVLLSNEIQETGEQRLLTHYVSTSLFGGGVGVNPSKHLVMLRGVTGMPGLTADQLKGYRTGALVGRLTRATVVHKMSAAGRRRAEAIAFQPAQEGDQAPPLDSYERPDFVRRMDVRDLGGQAAGGSGAAQVDLSALAPQPARKVNGSAGGPQPVPLKPSTFGPGAEPDAVAGDGDGSDQQLPF